MLDIPRLHARFIVLDSEWGHRPQGACTPQYWGPSLLELIWRASGVGRKLLLCPISDFITRMSEGGGGGDKSVSEPRLPDPGLAGGPSHVLTSPFSDPRGCRGGQGWPADQVTTERIQRSSNGSMGLSVQHYPPQKVRVTCLASHSSHKAGETQHPV